MRNEGLNLFGLLTEDGHQKLETRDTNNIATRDDINNTLNSICNNVKEKIDLDINSKSRQIKLIQAISNGRSGTYFLRTTLLSYSENIVPIHNTYTIPPLKDRSLLTMAQAISMGSNEEAISINLDQLSILAMRLEKHLLFFCIELISYANRFNKLPVIINHWWSPFALLLKSIFPNLEFISLTRSRQDLMHSMVEKYQIISNPMPADLHFTSMQCTYNKEDLTRWSNYFLNFTNTLEREIKYSYPDSYHGSISFTPPNEDSADKLIKIFNLRCKSEQIINANNIKNKKKIY